MKESAKQGFAMGAGVVIGSMVAGLLLGVIVSKLS